jgi:phosphate transport system substrate-binding protein
MPLLQNNSESPFQNLQYIFDFVRAMFYLIVAYYLWQKVPVENLPPTITQGFVNAFAGLVALYGIYRLYRALRYAPFFNKNNVSSLIVFTTLFTSACNNANSDNPDTIDKGTIAISIDETYKPVMEEQIKIFEARNPLAKINAFYKPEAECIKDFFEDTTRLIFISRPFTENEIAQALQKKIVVTRQLNLARDGVAFIVAKGTKSEYTQFQFEQMLGGKDNSRTIVFDNQNSSTLSYVRDTILKGNLPTQNIYAAKGGDDVIDYVSNNPKAIGAIGVSWIADKNDPEALAFLDKIDVVGILPYNDSLTRYRKPYVAYLANKEYPYLRELYFISKENWVGLGTGFVNYLAKDGQLAFGKARLFPRQWLVNFRNVVVK